MSDVFFLNDTGDVITASVLIDLTGATTMEFHVQKPDGLEEEWTAIAAQLDPGILSYTIVAGNLDQTGQYLFHGYVVDASANIHTFIMQAFLVASKYSAVCGSGVPDFCST